MHWGWIYDMEVKKNQKLCFLSFSLIKQMFSMLLDLKKILKEIF